jgi:hypothetical protein
MPDITIPDAAVEAVARLLRAEVCEAPVDVWDDPGIISNHIKDIWRLDARDMLTAAAPHIAAQALRDAADAWQINGWVEGDLPPRGSTRPVLIIGMAQRACDFIRERAARIEADHG